MRICNSRRRLRTRPCRCALEWVVAHIDLDYVSIWEDMSFKNGTLMSPKMFEEFCVPHYRRVTGFLKACGLHGIWVDTDANCWTGHWGW